MRQTHQERYGHRFKRSAFHLGCKGKCTDADVEKYLRKHPHPVEEVKDHDD
jgi:hypothetical protein